MTHARRHDSRTPGPVAPSTATTARPTRTRQLAQVTSSALPLGAWALSQTTAGDTSPDLLGRAALALVANSVAAAAGWMARAVTPGGAAAGWVIGVVIFLGTGWRGWLLLIAAFLCAAATTWVGLARKTALGIAEPRSGRRGAANALANTGLAAAAALVMCTPWADAASVAFVASLVAGASDTVASEIGKARGGRTVRLRTFAAVPPGTPGAVSVVGTVAGAAAATGLAGLAALLSLVPGWCVPVVAASALTASFVEGFLAATGERGGLATHGRNLITTATAATLALIVWASGR